MMRLLFSVNPCGNSCILCNDDPENDWKINAKIIKVLSQLSHSELCLRVLRILLGPCFFSILLGGLSP